MLNPELDYDQLAAQYRTDTRVRVENVLETAVAERLQEVLLKIPYELAYVAGDQNLSMSMEKLSSLSAEQRRTLFSGIYSEASRGVGFLYGRFHLNEAKHFKDKEDYGFLHDLFVFLNSGEMFEAVQSITGVDTIKKR